MSTLADIRTKVRRLTGRPSSSQITDAQIDDYVNTFFQYDLPATLRLFSQKSVYEFMTSANVDRYDMRTLTVWTGADTQPAIDVFINIKPPVFIAGYQSFWSQDREQFFRIYPQLAEISSTILGDGTVGPYTLSFANFPLLQNQVTAGTIDATGAVVNAIDVPTNRTTGGWNQINTNNAITGSINYITGALTITFSNNIPSGNEITFTAVPYAASRPQALLYYDNVITLRPVPDKSYLVQVNGYKRPTQLLSSSESPDLQQWWQYLAYGAAKKIFEDTMDPEGLNGIMRGFKEQERMVLRRTLVEKTNERTATIYTEMVNYPYSNFNNRF